VSRPVPPAAHVRRRVLGDVLLTLTKASGLSLRRLALACGLPYARVCDIRYRLVRVRPAELEQLGRVLPGLLTFLHLPPAATAPDPVPASAEPLAVGTACIRSALDQLPELVKVDAASAALGVSRFAIRELVRTQRLDSRRLGRLLYVTRASVVAFVNGDAR
jgi:hypothetical protein